MKNLLSFNCQTFRRAVLTRWRAFKIGVRCGWCRFRCPLLDIKACGRHVLRVLSHNPRVLNQLAKPVDNQKVHIRKDEPSYENSKENRWIQFLFVIVATIVAPISCCLDSIFKLIIGFVLVWNDSPWKRLIWCLKRCSTVFQSIWTWALVGSRSMVMERCFNVFSISKPMFLSF